MPAINLQSLSKPTSLTTQTDTGNPYSFQQWKQNNTNIDPRAATEQYNEYLKSWYKNRASTPGAMVSYVKMLYINFLKQLGLTAKNPEEQLYFSNVNYDDDLDLQGAISYYARKLKNVSRYLAERRNNIVYSKLKYNLLGTNSYLEGLFYSYILSVYAKKADNTGILGLVISNGDLVQYLPNLSDISGTFSVEIEELYDTANYFDRDPAVNISNYTATASGTNKVLYYTSLYEAPTEYLLDLIIQAINSANTLNPCYGVSGFVGTSVSNNMAANNVFVYTGDGNSSTFNLPGITNSDSTLYRVSIDGLLQTPNYAYTISVQNKNIVFSGIPPVGSEIVILAPTS
jgi:hypothetical protein